MCCVHIFPKLNDENANRNENAAKKQKVITPEVKFTSNANGIMEEVADCGNAGASPFHGNFREANLLTYARKVGQRDGKDEDVPEKVTKKFTLKEFSEILHPVKGQRTKCWQLIQT